MTSVQERHAHLAQSLYRKTLTKEAVWQIDPWTTMLTTEAANYKILLDRAENENNEPIVTVTINNQNNEFVDGFSDTSLSLISPTEGEPPFNNFWHLLDSLEKMARRQAMGADVALDRIIGELDDDVPF